MRGEGRRKMKRLWKYQQSLNFPTFVPMIRYRKDPQNIVTLIMDMSNRPVNVLNHELAAHFQPVLQHLQEEKRKKQLRGVIITSAKKSFMTGGDLEYLYRTDDPAEVYAFAEKLKEFFRALERPGVPVVAAINGTALGTGFELALACHHRIVLDAPHIKLGHPEIKIGIMPGGGGVVRLLWLLGIEKAFSIISGGHRFTPREALKAEMIDELAENEEEMLEKAYRFLLSHPEGRREWDIAGATIPGGSGSDPDTREEVSRLAAAVSKKYYNNFRAPQAILNTLFEASKVDFDTALRIEGRYFTELICHQQAKNMMKTFWFDYERTKAGLSRPKGFGKFRPRKVGIIGAGVMGSGIAYACLRENMEVVLKDVSEAVAKRGEEYAVKRLTALTESGEITHEEKTEHLTRLTITESAEDFSDCDLIIEAVFENENVKAKVTREAEQFMDEYSVFASNTVSLPISQIAAASSRPANFVGLHFFYPVEEKRLVEVVRGRATSDETIARAFDFVRAIRKTPIIVDDNWGFYAMRVQNTYILEGIQLLQEGISPAVIDNLGKQAGMPYGPLELADDLSLALVLRYERQAAKIYGKKYQRHPATDVLENMSEELARPGARKKAGFYQYEGEGKKIWTELTEHYPTTQRDYNRTEIIEKLLFVQVLEAAWCLEEKVIRTVPEGNLGSVFGWGFPAFKGGVFQYITDYGREAFIEKCKEYEEKHGNRFKIPKVWIEKRLTQEVDLDLPRVS